MLKIASLKPARFGMQNYGFIRADTQSEQGSRIYRVATLGVGIFIHLMVCWAILAIGYMNIEPILFFGIASLSAAGFLFFALAVALEWNLSLEGPDMNLPQMIWAVSVVIMTAYFAVELKPLIVLSGLAMIVLGVNRLTKREFLLFTA